jgi:hypothetical protein
MLIFCFFCGLE